MQSSIYQPPMVERIRGTCKFQPGVKEWQCDE